MASCLRIIAFKNCLFFRSVTNHEAMSLPFQRWLFWQPSCVCMAGSLLISMPHFSRVYFCSFHGFYDRPSWVSPWVYFRWFFIIKNLGCAFFWDTSENKGIYTKILYDSLHLAGEWEEERERDVKYSHKLDMVNVMI